MALAYYTCMNCRLGSINCQRVSKPCTALEHFWYPTLPPWDKMSALRGLDHYCGNCAILHPTPDTVEPHCPDCGNMMLQHSKPTRKR